MRRRRVGFLLIFGALVPLALAATAYACGVLATLKSSATVAAPGSTVTVSGVNYSSDMNAFTPVQIRWNSRTGPVLDTVTPVGGRFSEEITLPNSQPGWFVVNATQNSVATGAPKAGTPGRTTLRVQGASASGSSWSTGPGGGAAVNVGGGPGGPPLVPTLLGVVLSLGLLGSGLTLVSRSRTRKANRPLLGV